MKLPDWTKKELKLPKRSKKTPAVNSAAPKTRSAPRVPKLSRPKLNLSRGPKLSRPKLHLKTPKVAAKASKPKLSRPTLGGPKLSLKRPKTGLRAPKTNLKAPKLKTPKALENIKAPAGLGVLWRQLREQRLLPIVGLLIAGLIAIPLLLGSSSKDESTAAVSPGTAAGAGAKPAALVVQKWSPGLLGYKRRLDHGKPADPFESKAPEPSEAGSESTGGEGNETALSGEGETTPEVEPTPESPANEGGGGPEVPETEPEPEVEKGNEGESGGEKENPNADAIDVRVTTVHAPGTKTPTRTEYVGHQLPQLTKLPNENVPAFTYIGPSRDGKKAMLSVSPEVSAILGASKCVSGGNPCQVLALEIDAPETFVYGPRGLTFRIELLRIGPEKGTESAAGGTPSIAVGEAQPLLAARSH